MTVPDSGTILTAGIGLGNVAALVYLVRIVIKPVADTVRTMTEQMEELYNSRNAHAKQITEIETIHKLRGCDTPMKTIP